MTVHDSSKEWKALHFDYQADIDLLFAWLGEPCAAENVEVEPGIYIRVSPVTREPVSIEVLDCAVRFQADSRKIDQGFAERIFNAYARRVVERDPS